MFRSVLTLLILLIAPAAFAHPGMTDHYGGHKCFKGCEEWKLLYAEYHLHDKDGKPIRVEKPKPVRERRKRPAPVVVQEEPSLPAEEPQLPPKESLKPVRAAVLPQEEPFPLTVLLLLLAALLVLLLVTRRSRREGEG